MKFWPEWMWSWKICDVCQRSRLFLSARYCVNCGHELRSSDLPLKRKDWLSAWGNLAFYLWLIEAVLLGVAQIDEIGGLGMFGMFIPAGAFLAAFALVIV
jgi:hypothetical protein